MDLECNQFTKPFKSSRRRPGSCWEEQKRIVFPGQGVIDLPLQKGNRKKLSQWPDLRVSHHQIRKIEVLTTLVPFCPVLLGGVLMLPHKNAYRAEQPLENFPTFRIARAKTMFPTYAVGFRTFRNLLPMLCVSSFAVYSVILPSFLWSEISLRAV